jgi:hypothetical protein
MLPAFLLACQMLHTLNRMLPASPLACQMLRMQFHMLL